MLEKIIALIEQDGIYWFLGFLGLLAVLLSFPFFIDALYTEDVEPTAQGPPAVLEVPDMPVNPENTDQPP